MPASARTAWKRLKASVLNGPLGSKARAWGNSSTRSSTRGAAGGVRSECRAAGIHQRTHHLGLPVRPATLGRQRFEQAARARSPAVVVKGFEQRGGGVRGRAQWLRPEQEGGAASLLPNVHAGHDREVLGWQRSGRQ